MQVIFFDPKSISDEEDLSKPLKYLVNYLFRNVHQIKVLIAKDDKKIKEKLFHINRFGCCISEIDTQKEISRKDSFINELKTNHHGRILVLMNYVENEVTGFSQELNMSVAKKNLGNAIYYHAVS